MGIYCICGVADKPDYPALESLIICLFTLNGNQLKAVNDDATATASNGFEFKDGAKLATEYMYDANGSLIKRFE